MSARAIRVKGPWGPVYGPIDLDVDETVLTRAFAHMGEVLGLDWVK